MPEKTNNFQSESGSFNTFFLVSDFLKFWFFLAPLELVRYFSSFNAACLKFLSFKLMLTTFFKPWKNEYRDGLVGFSIAMGICFKTLILSIDVAVFLLLVAAEAAFILIFVAWPIETISLAFI
jgi:hypothetical protein